MTLNPAKSGYEVFDLTERQVVTFPGGAPMDPLTATPEAVKAVPDALLPPKKRGRKKGSKNRKTKKSSAAVASPKAAPVAKGSTPGAVAEPAPGVRAFSLFNRVAPAGSDRPVVWLTASKFWIGLITVGLTIGGAVAYWSIR